MFPNRRQPGLAITGQPRPPVEILGGAVLDVFKLRLHAEVLADHDVRGEETRRITGGAEKTSEAGEVCGIGGAQRSAAVHVRWATGQDADNRWSRPGGRRVAPAVERGSLCEPRQERRGVPGVVPHGQGFRSQAVEHEHDDIGRFVAGVPASGQTEAQGRGAGIPKESPAGYRSLVTRNGLSNLATSRREAMVPRTDRTCTGTADSLDSAKAEERG